MARSKDQRRSDLRETARLRLEGHKIPVIAERIGVSERTIKTDLAAIRAVWHDDMVGYVTDAKAQAIAELDALKAEAWDAWRSSRAPGEDKEWKGAEDKLENCPQCRGRGWVQGGSVGGTDLGQLVCPTCNGEKKVAAKEKKAAILKVRKRVRNGDARLLREIRECIVAQAEIAGVYVKPKEAEGGSDDSFISDPDAVQRRLQEPVIELEEADQILAALDELADMGTFSIRHEDAKR